METTEKKPLKAWEKVIISLLALFSGLSVYVGLFTCYNPFNDIKSDCNDIGSGVLLLLTIGTLFLISTILAVFLVKRIKYKLIFLIIGLIALPYLSLSVADVLGSFLHSVYLTKYEKMYPLNQGLKISKTSNGVVLNGKGLLVGKGKDALLISSDNKIELVDQKFGDSWSKTYNPRLSRDGKYLYYDLSEQHQKILANQSYSYGTDSLYFYNLETGDIVSAVIKNNYRGITTVFVLPNDKALIRMVGKNIDFAVLDLVSLDIDYYGRVQTQAFLKDNYKDVLTSNDVEKYTQKDSSGSDFDDPYNQGSIPEGATSCYGYHWNHDFTIAYGNDYKLVCGFNKADNQTYLLYNASNTFDGTEHIINVTPGLKSGSIYYVSNKGLFYKELNSESVKLIDSQPDSESSNLSLIKYIY